MKTTYIGIAFLCAWLLSGVIAGSNPAYSMPQTAIENPRPDNSAQNSCVESHSPVEVHIQLNKADQTNLELARHMERVMSQYGYDIAITRALYRAHLKTGVDFRLLVLKAIIESDYGRFNVAANSSARGVFQYIEPTWLVLMHRYGKKAGYGHYADAITYSKKTKMASLSGTARYLRGEILALRHNPEAAAIIKAFQILEETDVIRGYKRGKSVTATDHYIAHMLGLYVMKDFYGLIERRSVIAPAKLSTNVHMREAAITNKGFFFKGKTPLSAMQSYKRFEAKVEQQFRKISDMKKAEMIEVSNITCTNETGTPIEAPETLKTVIR